jgi:hypothetical protein
MTLHPCLLRVVYCTVASARRGRSSGIESVLLHACAALLLHGANSAAISTERGFLGVRRELGGEMCISSSGEVYEEARCASFSSA